MKKNEIPTPTCSTCGESDSKDYIDGETTYLCKNCGTEMRYLPAGELLKPAGSKVKENNGWVTSFSVRSSELYSSQVMFGLGLLILILSLSFLWFEQIKADAAIWSSGSGILLSIIGKRRLSMQKEKIQIAFKKYPYWRK